MFFFFAVFAARNPPYPRGRNFDPFNLHEARMKYLITTPKKKGFRMPQGCGEGFKKRNSLVSMVLK